MKTIKEIITAEKRAWIEGYSAIDMLDRIEAGVTAYVAEMEEALDVSYNAEREALKQRVADLEREAKVSEQFYKVVITQRTNSWRRIDELEKELGVAYKQGYDEGHTDGFTEGYNEKEQELT